MCAHGTDIDRSPRPSDREHKVLFEHLATWERRSLLTHEEVDAIARFEEQQGPRASRVPLIAEVVAYLGAALAVGAVVALVGPRWGEISHGQKLLGAGTITVALLLAGAYLRGVAEPAARRLAGVLWTLGLGAMTGFLALVLFDLAPGQDPAPWSVFVLGMTVGLAARLLLLWLPCEPLMVAMFVGTVAAVVGAGVWGVESGWTWLDDFRGWPAIAILLASLPFLVAGATGALTPDKSALALGAIGVVIAPMYAMEWTGFGLLLGVGVSIALLGSSVWLRNTPMLIGGALGLFGYLVGTIVYFLSDTVGVPLALLLSGAVLIGVAVVTARLRRLTDREGPEAEI
jgi:hypothetical protein